MQKLFTLTTFLTVFFFFTPISTNAQDWLQLGNIEGAETLEISSNDAGFVFAYVSEGRKIYRKHKDEVFWQPIELPTIIVFGNITIGSGSNIYLYDLVEMAWWNSPDNGDTWQISPTQFPSIQTDLIKDLGNGIMLSTDGFYVHKTVDGGQTWQEVLSVTQSFGYLKIAVDPFSGDIYLPATTASSGSLIYKSTDDGDNWENILIDDRFTDFNINPNNGNLMMATEDGLFSSGDGGTTWDSFGNQPDQNGSPAIHKFGYTPSGRIIAHKITAQLEGNLYYSDDDGMTWSPILQEESISIKDLHITQTGGIYGFRQGIVSSKDGGINWSMDMKGIDQGIAYDYAENAGGVAFIASGEGVFRSSDQGASWEMIHRNPTTKMPHIELNDAGDLYVLYTKQLFISTDNGETFQQLDAPEVDSAPYSYVTYPKFKVHPSGALFILNLFEIYRSLDNGLTWTASDMPYNCAGILIDDNGNIVAHNNQSVAYSTDIGDTWQINDFPDFDISVSNNFFLFGDGELAYIFGNPTQRYTSTDFGETWSSFDCPGCFASGNINHCIAQNDFVFTSTTSTKIRFSIDRGQSWNYLPPLPDGSATRVFYTPSNKLMTSARNGSIFLFDPALASVSGTLKLEKDDDCVAEPQDNPVDGWKVAADGNGQTYYGFSGNQGQFLMPARTGDYNVHAIPPNNLWEVCETPISVAEQNLYMEFPLGGIAVRAKETCPYMTVDVSADILRRCFDGSLSVRYSNTGTVKAEGAYVVLEIDPYLEITSTSLPIVNQDGRTFTFFLGDVDSGKSGSFKIDFTVSCDAELGQWHCVEASIYPNEICGDYPDWTGSVIEVGGVCNGDETIFTISNTGAGDMQQTVAYDILNRYGILSSGQLLLNAGTSTTVSVESVEDVFFRTMDEEGYPFPGRPSAFVKSCNSQINYINFWPSYLHLGNSEPFKSSFCQQNRGSFDPNDKTASPVGFGENHLLEANVPIDYLIRFQNTGTDTAFKVVVIDTLAEWLDPASIELGASSHPYTFEMSGSREDGGVILKFIFDNIMLPDSNINEVASHGFVKFHIAQMPELPIGTRIENKAAIYFDLNEPIITNVAWHTIGEDFYPTVNSTTSKWLPDVSLDMSPNPYSTAALIKLNGIEKGDFQLKIFDLTGKVLLEDSFSENKYLLQQDGLQSGVMVVGIYQNNLPVVFDKLVKINK